jgi:hypothetical protein
MIKAFLSVVALTLFATFAGAPAAHADACSDLQNVIQNPQTGGGAADVADQIRGRAQQTYNLLCPSGAAADASAPTHTPAQLASADLASQCPAYSDPPMPPDGATPMQARAALNTFNTWADANDPVMTCHHDEVTKQQRETAVYDAAELVWQQQLTAQMAQLQASFAQQRAAFAEAHGRH